MLNKKKNQRIEEISLLSRKTKQNSVPVKEQDLRPLLDQCRIAQCKVMCCTHFSCQTGSSSNEFDLRF